MHPKNVGLALLVLMVALWAAAALFGFIGSTVFIGHMSMLALALAAASIWRSDAPTKDE